MQCCTVRKELLLGLEPLHEEYSLCLIFGCNSVLKIRDTFPEASFTVNGASGAGFPRALIGTLELDSCQSWLGRPSIDHLGSLGTVLSLLFCYESINQIHFEVIYFALLFCLHLEELPRFVKRQIYFFKKSFPITFDMKAAW